MVGETVSHYRILERLGAGGMGEVYRAQDTQLARSVAIKILPAHHAADTERRRRFLQEARAVSALNHPNIISIYDIVFEGDTAFMVMEYVAGNTLADLVPAGGLPVAEALEYAIQMAGALEAAHGAGIVHRDFKPGNVMVSKPGWIKVLDFGLAKRAFAGPDVGLNDQTATLGSGPLTVEGSVVGTISYMSPEQAEGKPVDARSDVFSFGAVLYEMLTGRRAFKGESALSTLTAILRDNVPAITQFSPGVPLRLEDIVRRCLAKDPAARWQNMAEIRAALTAVKRGLDAGIVAAPTEKPARRGRRKAAFLGIAVAAAAAVFAIVYSISKPVSTRGRRGGTAVVASHGGPR